MATNWDLEKKVQEGRFWLYRTSKKLSPKALLNILS
jgi:hypothetical protein